MLLLGAALVASAWWVVAQTGRTPGELIDYSKRRLQGHPRLEALAVPVLDRMVVWLGESDRSERGLTFVVPPLPPNPLARGVESGGAGVIRVGPGRAITRIGVAAQMAKDGSVIEIDAGDYIADVATWDRASLTIRGLGDRVRLIAAGASAGEKAIWVVRRGRVVIENIEFVGARVPDRNGAGIRLEAGQLLVRNCSFIDNESGILTADDPGATLDVESSTFSYTGYGDGLSHAVYIGAIARFRLSGSYVHHANVGHLVKSRARVNRIEYNRLTDESGGRASYELDLPNGGLADVVGNIIQQSASTRNSVIVSFGEEGYHWPQNELRFVHNTVVNDHPLGGTFLRVAKGAGFREVRNNVFSGAGKLDLGSGAVEVGNQKASWADFVRAGREDYRLSPSARQRWQAADSADRALVPAQEYVHPARTQPLKASPRWPGAIQAAAP